MIIKRWNGSAFVKEFPETKAQLIRNDGDTDFVFDGNDKIKPAYLPNSVFDSLFYYTTFSTNSSARVLADEAIQNAISLGRSPNGYYWVQNSGGTRTLTPNSTTIEYPAASGRYHQAIIAPAEEGISASTDTAVTMENGDWVVLNSVTGTGTSVNPYVSVFAIVNNTYENATTAVDGIVKLSDATTYSSLTGNHVVTEGILKTVIDNASFSTPSHTHGNINSTGQITATSTPATGQSFILSGATNELSRSSLVLGTSTTTYLTNAGTWATPAGTYAHPTQTAINVDATNDGITVIDSVVVNTAGHVTSVGTRTLSAATASVPGHMTAAYASKLDGIATGANAYAHPNHSGDVTSVGDGAQTIAANAVSNTKLADMAGSTIKGRLTASTGDPEDLTAAQVRTLINVADGANNYSHPTQTAIDVNATDDGINVIDRVQVNTAGHVTAVSTRNLGAATASVPGHMTAAYASKLDGITAGATNQTAKALGGLSISSNEFQMVHPFFVQADAPATPLTGTIWFDL